MTTEKAVSKAEISAHALYPPRYRVTLVRESTEDQYAMNGPSFTAPESVAAFAAPLVRDEPVELFVVLMLTTNNQPIGFNVVARGGLSQAAVDVRSVFQPALLSNAAAIICLHNHPSGNVEPSREDIHLTRRLVQAGNLLNTPVHDHLVLGPDGSFVSLAERGVI